MLLYHVMPAEQMRKSRAQTLKKGAGYVYITDALGPVP